MMKARVLGVAALLSVAFSHSVLASTVTWQLENVRFNDGGTATGWFSVDNVSHTFLSWDFFVSGGNTAIFSPFEYNPTTSLFIDDDSGAPYTDTHYTLPLRDGFRFIVYEPAPRRDLRIAFNDLPDGGGVVSLNLLNELGVECFNCGPYRLITGGEISAPLETPLPGTLPLFATGLSLLGLLGWRRKRKAAALAA